jgi:AraC-like DNA-binding protein
LEEFGQSPWGLLRNFGIGEADFANPRRQLPVALHAQVLGAAAKAMECPHLGLLIGERASLNNVGELRFLLLNAATVRQAIDHLMRFVRLTHPAIGGSVEHEGGYTCLRLRLNETVACSEHLLLTYLASTVKALRMVIAPSWNPVSVHLGLQMPTDDTAFRRFFRATLLFDQPEYSIFLPDSLLDNPRSKSDPLLAEFVFEHLCRLEAMLPGDFIGNVTRIVEKQLLCNRCDVDTVAGFFAVHRKTLHGYLRQAGTTFTEIRDQRRMALAIRMLEQTSLQLVQIAEALGFRNQASLTRAFRRRHDCAPSHWRRASVPQASGDLIN